jgi:acyl-CoA synthetase (AMP-forming)/AMP-acid ligase II
VDDVWRTQIVEPRGAQGFTNHWHIGATERVAIVLPNGPEMAVAFVTVAQSATTAPLNPAYKEDEFAF